MNSRDRQPWPSPSHRCRARAICARPAGAPAAPARERLLSLDVFRGMTVAGMLLVNDPGTWGAIYPPLEHAAWHGWTPTDLIFPFFLFIVGITTHLSLSARRRARGDGERAIRAQIIRRGALIFLFGLLVNGFPYFTWGDVAGVADPSLRRAHRRPAAPLAHPGRAAAHRRRLHRRRAAHPAHDAEAADRHHRLAAPRLLGW